jgi:hypothetical protein
MKCDYKPVYNVDWKTYDMDMKDVIKKSITKDRRGVKNKEFKTFSPEV